MACAAVMLCLVLVPVHSAAETPPATASTDSVQPKRSLARARTAADAGDVDLASRLYTSVLRERRSLIWLHVEYGEFLLGHGRLVEARRHLGFAAKREPLNTRALTGVARCLDAAGDIDGAKRLYQRVLMTAPRDLRARFQLGRLQYETGQLVAAEATYRELIARNPGHWMGMNNLGMILIERGEPAAASGPLKAALKMRPEDPSILYNLGRMSAALGAPRRALRYYDQALEHSGSGDLATVQVHYDRGRALAALNRYQSAVIAFERCLSLDDAYSPAHLELAGLFAGNGRDQRALEHLERAVDYERERVELYQVLAERALDRGDPDAALRALTLARGLDEVDGTTWLLFGRAYGEKGAGDDRVAALDKACRLGVETACR